MYSPRLHYPDVTHNNIEHTSAILHHHPIQARFNYDQQLKTAGSERQLQYYNMADLVEGMHLLHLYKPPPPYPSNRLSSNSTPDLAVASQRFNIPVHNFGAGIGHVSGSSPDLVSTKTLLNRHYLKQVHQLPYDHHISHGYLQSSNAHGTYENLASVIDNKHYVYDATTRQPTVIVENRDITKHIQKIIDEHGNIIYCMPALMENQAYPSNTSNYLKPSNEPIYENVPLPWQGNELARERAESIQSAPETLPGLRNHLQFEHRTSLQTQLNNKEGMYENLPPKIYPNESITQAFNSQINTVDNNNRLYNQTVLQENNNLETQQLSQLNQSSSLNNSTSNSTNSVHRKLSSSKQSKDETDFQKNHNLSNNNVRLDNENKQENSAIVCGNFGFNMSPENYNHDVSSKTENTENSAIDLSKLSDLSYQQISHNSTFTIVDTSQGSSASAKDKKRRRWGLLVGKSKSTDKAKSATLGREKNKSNIDVKEKHRWSTGLPRFQPLPPTINKETMVMFFFYSLSFLRYNFL